MSLFSSLASGFSEIQSKYSALDVSNINLSNIISSVENSIDSAIGIKTTQENQTNENYKNSKANNLNPNNSTNYQQIPLQQSSTSNHREENTPLPSPSPVSSTENDATKNDFFASFNVNTINNNDSIGTTPPESNSSSGRKIIKRKSKAVEISGVDHIAIASPNKFSLPRGREFQEGLTSLHNEIQQQINQENNDNTDNHIEFASPAASEEREELSHNAQSEQATGETAGNEDQHSPTQINPVLPVPSLEALDSASSSVNNNNHPVEHTTPGNDVEESQVSAEIHEEITQNSAQEGTQLSVENSSLLAKVSELELLNSKLARLLKIRELQLEKTQFQSAATEENYNQTLNQLQTVTQENNSLKERLNNAINNTANKNNASDIDSELQRKSEELSNVLSEAQSLMAKHQQLEQKHKKARLTIETLNQQIETLTNELNTTKTSLSSSQASLTAEQEGKKDLEYKYKELNSMREKNSSLATQLSSSEYSIQCLRVELTEKESIITNLQESIESIQLRNAAAQEQIQLAQSDLSDHTYNQQNLIRNIEELRNKLSSEQEASAMEIKKLNETIAELRLSLLQQEGHHDELVLAVPQATKPLIRQIEGLKNQLQSNNETAEILEQQLRNQIKQLEIAAIHHKNEISQLKEEKTKLELQLTECNLNQSNFTNKQQQYEAAISKLNNKLNEANEKLTAQQQELDENQGRIKQLKQNDSVLQAEIDQFKHSHSNHSIESRDTIETLKQSLQKEQQQRKQLEFMLQNKATSNAGEKNSDLTPSNDSSSASDSLFNSSDDSLSFSSGVNTAIVENLRLLIRQREGQLRTAQSTVNQLKERLEYAEQQLIRYSDYSNLQSRYDAALLIIGEKSEEFEDLSAEFDYVKNKFREQIQQAFQAIEELKLHRIEQTNQLLQTVQEEANSSHPSHTNLNNS
jgi:hypothetical protein